MARSAGVSVLSGHVIDCFLYRHTVADVFVFVIPGPDPGIQVDRLARTRALCVACGLRPCRILRFAWIHSCAGRNRGHTVRANAATPKQSYFLLSWVKIGRLRNTKITGAGWSPLFHRDIFICTITWIPRSGPGMTKAVVCFFILYHGAGGVTERMAKKALLLRHPVRGADTPAPQRGTWSATGDEKGVNKYPWCDEKCRPFYGTHFSGFL